MVADLAGRSAHHASTAVGRVGRVCGRGRDTGARAEQPNTVPTRRKRMRLVVWAIRTPHLWTGLAASGSSGHSICSWKRGPETASTENH